MLVEKNCSIIINKCQQATKLHPSSLYRKKITDSIGSTLKKERRHGLYVK